MSHMFTFIYKLDQKNLLFLKADTEEARNQNN